MNSREKFTLTRRDLLRLSIMTGGATLLGSRIMRPTPALGQAATIDEFTGCGVGGEAFPTSPFILNPFTDPLPIPQAMLPGWRRPDGTLAPTDSDAWTVRMSGGNPVSVISRPGPGPGQQDSHGARPRTAGVAGPAVPDAGTHQLWTDGTGVSGGPLPGFPLPDPILYHIRLQVREHSFTSSPVQPIDVNGQNVVPPDGIAGPRALPPSTIYGFNGTFPGPLINTEYGKPALVRFENDLDLNPLGRDRQDFGAPDWAFLTHLHNGHTSPESDGQPHHMFDDEGGYRPRHWSDNLYLMYPAANDPAEKQSFLWFHDHRMHHTGANVYKGMVGLMPHYDPVLDPGDERRVRGSKSLRLPGIRTNNPDGTFNVKYDIPLALYDWAADDGVTPHQDFHNGCGETHPEWWGQSFFRHYPNHGFVGDIFTVNGVAFPVLNVERRRYRLRFLGASIARDYDLWLMTGTPTPAPGTQGQWQLPDGQQCMQFTQIASEGGLLPKAIVRDHFEIWPAKRREFVVDFSKYMDGTPTTTGDEIYLVNTLFMPNGRKPVIPGEPDFDPDYRVPMMKIVIGNLPAQPDQSTNPGTLRNMPKLPNLAGLVSRRFELKRGGSAGGETEWLINDLEFNPLAPLALTVKGRPELWNVVNGGGGWTHPMHMHMEEHTVLSRNGLRAPVAGDLRHVDDTGKEDVVALDPGESVVFYRNFRTFKGNYVAHCHNLAHEDHNMMFGWSIT